MGKVFVITNRKGGCGKSFTTASLGVGLARQGKKVLLLDTDNQHSLTVSMGVTEPENLPVTIATVITDIINKKEIDPAAGLIRHSEEIDLMPANSSLTGMEISLAPLMGREILIKKYLGKVKHLYDYCLIDTSPTLDILTINALAAADGVIIPVTPKYLDAKGLELLLKSIADMQEFINPSLSICGILLTMVDKRTNFTKQIINVIEEAYGESIRIFKEHIPHSIRAAETSATGKSIFTHDPNGKIAAAYAALTREVLEDA
jgi:chromosome partitioning protein